MKLIRPLSTLFFLDNVLKIRVFHHCVSKFTRFPSTCQNSLPVRECLEFSASHLLCFLPSVFYIGNMQSFSCVIRLNAAFDGRLFSIYWEGWVGW